MNKNFSLSPPEKRHLLATTIVNHNVFNGLSGGKLFWPVCHHASLENNPNVFNGLSGGTVVARKLPPVANRGWWHGGGKQASKTLPPRKRLINGNLWICEAWWQMTLKTLPPLKYLINRQLAPTVARKGQISGGDREKREKIRSESGGKSEL